MTVPLDYRHPQGRTIQIALERRKATDPTRRIGSLVINPGGPGDSGINDLPAELRVLTPDLQARFDIVSFDPRGVARSAPVHCSAGGTSPTPSQSGPLPDPVPQTDAARQALLDSSRSNGQACLANSAGVLAFVGTVDTARDLDGIRAALGDDRLTFFGHSYGSLLGATYADMFPTHVRGDGPRRCDRPSAFARSDESGPGGGIRCKPSAVLLVVPDHSGMLVATQGRGLGGFPISASRRSRPRLPSRSPARSRVG